MVLGILSEMTLPEARAFEPQVVMAGVGSCEPHGPALPYGTDTFRADALCRRAAEMANAQGGRVLALPTLPIGVNVNFKKFPFACRIGVRTMMSVVLDMIQAVEEEGVRKMVIVNGHGGNRDALTAALREHFDRTPEERRAFVCLTSGAPRDRGLRLVEHPSPHGGEAETSLMLSLRPDLVKAERLVNNPIAEPEPELVNLDQMTFVRPWDRYVPAGAGGVVEKASAEKGARMMDNDAAGLADFLVSLSKAPWRPGFPYADARPR